MNRTDPHLEADADADTDDDDDCDIINCMAACVLAGIWQSETHNGETDDDDDDDD